MGERRRSASESSCACAASAKPNGIRPFPQGRRIGWLVMSLLLVQQFAAAAEEPPRGEPGEAPWQPLFDGKTLSGWRNYQAKSGAPVKGWSAVDGTLARTGPGGDLITEAEYRNFELALEWRVEQGGNSGIFIRATEAEPRIYEAAPEMQVLDDAHHRDGRDPLTSAGANYSLHPAPRGVVKPAGKWNSVRLRVHGNQVTHWLNGQRIVDYELGSDDWKKRVANSKFAAWPNYGRAERGHIGLQDHGDPVAFRNIRIRVLADTP